MAKGYKGYRGAKWELQVQADVSADKTSSKLIFLSSTPTGWPTPVSRRDSLNSDHFLSPQETADFILILLKAAKTFRSFFEKDQDVIKILAIISTNRAPSHHELSYEPGIRLVPKIIETLGSIEKSLRVLVRSPTDWNDEDKDNEGNNPSKRATPEHYNHLVSHKTMHQLVPQSC
ncbi:hypothetical protein C8J56DRAFT_884013 [Mycena floridula]|nr:hypothetical protein C8J56DRAFT_884013 [Mycena floridula]